MTSSSNRTGPAALTGPVARGDAGTVARHRAVIADRTPELTGLFDALVRATERLAGTNPIVSAGPGVLTQDRATLAAAADQDTERSTG